MGHIPHFSLLAVWECLVIVDQGVPISHLVDLDILNGLFATVLTNFDCLDDWLDLVLAI